MCVDVKDFSAVCSGSSIIPTPPPPTHSQPLHLGLSRLWCLVRDTRLPRLSPLPVKWSHPPSLSLLSRENLTSSEIATSKESMKCLTHLRRNFNSLTRKLWLRYSVHRLEQVMAFLSNFCFVRRFIRFPHTHTQALSCSIHKCFKCIVLCKATPTWGVGDHEYDG